eukprot:TRINITY_DN8443_c0_g1_i1.p1 TRINITY_DN8443_c0_g1~~TRINITY_DN8443_c0_g1_i1.p1  ORF type:complete len:319 (-),score=34.66 TRINITY_DN8443_c0_g1_i1:2-958(-)
MNSFAKAVTGPTYIDEIGQSFSTNPTFYKTAPCSASYMSTDYSNFANLSATLISQAKKIYLAFLGPNCPADQVYDGPMQPTLNTFVNSIGYRFVIIRISYANEAAQGGDFDVNFDVVNTGTSGCYLKWPFELSLSIFGAVNYTSLVYEDLGGWLPGGIKKTITFTIPENAETRKYDVWLAILDPSDNTPGMQVAKDGARKDGRLCIGKLTIVSPGFKLIIIISITVGICVFSAILIIIIYCIGKERNIKQDTQTVTPSETRSNREPTNPETKGKQNSPKPITPVKDSNTLPELNTDSGETRSRIVVKSRATKNIQFIN